MNEELKIYITAQIDGLKKHIDEAQKEVQDLNKKGSKNFKEFADAASKVGGVANKALKVVAVSVVAAAGALLGLSVTTKEYRTEQAKLVTAFEAAGASAEVAKETYNGLFRVLGDTAVATEAANHLAQLTTNQQDLSEWTNICQGVYATFGDSLPIESLTEAANETAKTGELTGALADALNWAGVSEADFAAKLAACNTEAEREALIRQTLSGLYDEAAEGYEKNAAGVLAENEAQNKLNEATAKLGELMAPIKTMLVEFGAVLAEKVAPIVEDFAVNKSAAMADALANIAEKIGNVLTWLIDNWELVKTIGTIILATAAAISVLTGVITIVNAVISASPVTWIVLGIVAAIAALIAIIVVIIKYWDEIKAAATKAWQAIVNAWNNAANWFNTKIVQPIVNFFKNMWNGLTNGAKQAWEGVKNVFSKVTDWFKNVFSNAWQAVKNVFSTGGKIFTGIKDGIANVFKTIVNGIIGGINRVISVPFNAINNMLSRLRNIEILGVSPFGWINTFSVPQIPLLAKGGIVNSATLAVVGEQGKEAVIPLENNTQWIDQLADKIANKQGNGRVILTIDKRVLGQVAVEGINDITKLTGTIPLRLA